MKLQYMPLGATEMEETEETEVAEPIHVLTGPSNTIRTTITHEGVIIDLTDEEGNEVLATNGRTFSELLGEDE
jgi:hypothetical protein